MTRHLRRVVSRWLLLTAVRRSRPRRPYRQHLLDPGPRLGLGWPIPPGHLRADLAASKHASDLRGSVLPQLVPSHLLARGAYRPPPATAERPPAQASRCWPRYASTLAPPMCPGHRRGTAPAHHTAQPPRRPRRHGLADTVRDVGVLVHPLSWDRQRPDRRPRPGLRRLPSPACRRCPAPRRRPPKNGGRAVMTIGQGPKAAPVAPIVPAARPATRKAPTAGRRR